MSLSQDMPADFRVFLQSELINRCNKNRKYSLRAFARAVDFESSALSKILNGQRKITESTIKRIGGRLGLDPIEIERYLANQGNSKVLDPQAQFSPLSIEAFRVISDWYHFAILELMRVKQFQSNPKWVAKVLDITVSEVNIALGNLSRLGLIEISRDGKWIDRGGNNSIAENYDVEAAQRKLQRQILEKAIEALVETQPENRDNTAVTCAINTKKLPEVRARITRFRRELTAFFEKDSVRDQVYHLAIALYPVSKIFKEKGVKR